MESSNEISLVIQNIKEAFDNAKNIIVIPHSYPDGDAIGSALGIYLTLKATNKKVSLISPNGFPDFLKCLPHCDEIILANKTKSNIDDLFNKADLIICVDFNMANRMENLENYVKQSKALKILIDHHPEPENFCDYIYQTTQASSAAELVFDVIEKTGYKKYMNTEIATNIYAGIMTDTGCFSYSSSNPNTFRVASELMKYGVNADIVYDSIYNNFSFDRMRLLGLSLNEKMTYLPEYKTAYITLSAKELKNYSFKAGDTEGFVNYPLSIKGVIFSAIFIEKANNIKISFRSKGSFPVNKFAIKHFNGGGHVNAAGGESYENLNDCVNKFIALLKNYEDDLNI
ncbi:MAG TPA: bifunctional oligoribonuclease/PAP phosphatase NrnA [Bacteroidales bacterium]|nr:bifunctional oligoribonuclease/PAP phosphatase NrnA [Bacteroidales bacterium]